MDLKNESSSSTRKWWLLVGGVVAFIVVFNGLEGLVRPDPPEDTTPVEVAIGPPVVSRSENGGIEIRHKFFRRSTIHLVNEDKEKALFDCITAGIARKFEGGTEGWRRGRFEAVTQQVQFECLRSLQDTPTPPHTRPVRD